MITCTCGSTDFRAERVNIEVSVHIQTGDTVSMDLYGLKPGDLTVACVSCGQKATSTYAENCRDIGEDVTVLTGLPAARQLMLNAMYEVEEIVPIS